MHRMFIFFFFIVLLSYKGTANLRKQTCTYVSIKIELHGENCFWVEKQTDALNGHMSFVCTITETISYTEVSNTIYTTCMYIHYYTDSSTHIHTHVQWRTYTKRWLNFWPYRVIFLLTSESVHTIHYSRRCAYLSEGKGYEKQSTHVNCSWHTSSWIQMLYNNHIILSLLCSDFHRPNVPLTTVYTAA